MGTNHNPQTPKPDAPPPSQQISGAPRLGEVRCCGTCIQQRGWLDNMWCGLHTIAIRPYLICIDYRPQSSNPDLIIEQVRDGQDLG